MTEAQPVLGEPRWHADPEGGEGLRWWDGTQWTASVMDSNELAPPVQRPLADGTPVYTVPLWVLVFLPVLSPLILLLDVGSAGLLRNLLNLAVYAGAILLAYADHRALQAAGYQRPFHWGWSFLSSGVYVVGRSIIVNRRIGRGLTPIWVWAAVAVLALTAGIWILMPR
jgi:hypothetical protein